MSGGEGQVEAGGGEVLDTLDLMAAHVIEARALLMTLGEPNRGDLRVMIDCLLAEIGRGIAAELPRSSILQDAE